jgi:hypothetical protein
MICAFLPGHVPDITSPIVLIHQGKATLASWPCFPQGDWCRAGMQWTVALSQSPCIKPFSPRTKSRFEAIPCPSSRVGWPAPETMVVDAAADAAGSQPTPHAADSVAVALQPPAA